MDLILLPFRLLWSLVTAILGLTGRLVAIVLGLVLVILGGLLTLTIIGAVIGIPMIIIGLLLIWRGLF